MERKLTIPKEFGKKFRSACRKYRYVGLVLLVGVVLLLWPEKKQEKQTPQALPAVQQTDLTAQLVRVLGQIEGAGEVDVVLTYETDTETVYQMQSRIQQDADGGTEEEVEAVLAGSGGGEPVAVKTIYPRCRGALVVCDGADSAQVRLAIKEAVACLTGLGTDRISVVKRE